MARPVVSTTLGAEGLGGMPGRHLLIADDPSDFANSVLRVLQEPQLGAQLGREGRALAVERFSWQGAAAALEAFIRQTLARRDAASASPTRNSELRAALIEERGKLPAST